MMVYVSIIVPVYGVEKYLRRCINSLINQTLKNIEIILIDDASPDKSYLIMKEYEKDYPEKIRCIYLKENIRQGGARNIGVKESKGEYILFVDSDDWVDFSICEKLYLRAKENNSDIVFCDMIKVWEDSLKKEYVMQVGNEISGELTVDKYKELLSLYSFPPSKLIRRSIIVDNNLYFPEKTRYEDLAVVPFYTLYSKRATKINEALYYYNIHLGSTMRLKNSNHHFERMTTSLLFYNDSKIRGFYEQYKREIDFLFIRSYCFFVLESCLNSYDKLPKEKMLEISKNIKKILPDYLTNYYINKISDPKHKIMAQLNDIDPDMLLYWQTNQNTQEISYFNFYNETTERAMEIFAYCKKCGYNIALWGAGQKGTEFLQSNDYESKHVKYVIDRDVKKHGTILPSGHCVSSYDKVIDDIDVIFVCNRYHYGSVFSEIRALDKDIYIINLDVILTYNIDIKDYFK